MRTAKKEILYPYVLDYKPGFFLTWFLYRLFKRVRLDENMKEDLKRMHRAGTVVYATKYRGKLDYLLYHYNFRRRRLPYPKIAFDLNMSLLLPFKDVMKSVTSKFTGYLRYGHFPSPYQTGFYRKAIEEGTTFLMFLIDPKGFLRHFLHAEKDQIQFLLETQMETNRPIFIVPQLVLFQKIPEKDYSNLSSILFGFKDHPGFIRKIVLFFRHNRQAFIDFGTPLDLQGYLKGQPSGRPLSEMASEIRQMCIDGIDNQKRVILGPIMKSRQQVKEMVLMDRQVIGKIESMAAGDKKRLKHMRKKAGEYFDEIAADYNITYVQFFHMALSWFWKKIFEGVDVDGASLARVREWARRGTLIYVPSHKSHIDYLVLNDVLFDHHMHIPRIAAGKNLAFWPMGHIFRKSGAFFIRRSFRRAKLYLEVFNRYIKTLIEEGHPIEVFIEGGRSRNGKLVLPKTGLISILLQAYQEGQCKDLIFVPTSIIYDRIIEESSYRKEVNGGAKENEHLGQIIRARRFLKRRYGKIYIRFNEAFSLNEYLSKRDPSSKDTHRQLAFDLVQSINDVSLVIPLSLISTAILANHRRGFHYIELKETADLLLAFLVGLKAPIADTLKDSSKAIEDTLALLKNWKVVECLEDTNGEEEPFYFVDDDKKVELEYYKNSIIHFFIPHSFVAISLLSGTEEAKDLESILSDYAFLKHLFKNEFVFSEREEPRGGILTILGFFVEASFLSESETHGGYQITKLGFDKLPIWAALTKTFLESYWIAFKSISQHKNGRGKKAELLKNMNYMGKRFYKLGLIDHVGALSQFNFQNALTFMNSVLHEIDREQEETPDSADRLSRLGQKIYEFSHYRP